MLANLDESGFELMDESEEKLKRFLTLGRGE
jgi:hypothetical protein